MICERCHERPATIHLTKVINYEKAEMHLCEVCAKAAGNELGIIIEPNFTFQNLIAGLLEGEFNIYQHPGKSSDLRCQSCGLTLSDFRNHGLLGCGECYQYFQNNLEPLFKRVHGSVAHTGKVPRRTGGIFRVKKEIDQLRNELQQAINNEEYEKAAILRDEIRRLQHGL